jgi:hypothetical protein
MGRTVRVLRLNRISLSSRLLSQDIAGLHPPLVCSAAHNCRQESFLSFALSGRMLLGGS